MGKGQPRQPSARHRGTAQGAGVVELTGGFFLVDWIVCWFLASGMTREYNEQTANEIIGNIRYASGQ